MNALVKVNFVKFEKALVLLKYSVQNLPEFDVNFVDDPEKMIPFDALFSRFERLVEISIGKLFRSIEFFQQGSNASSVRERLSFMEKAQIISSVDTWMEIREFRNKIAHDYLPDQISQMHVAISNRFMVEFEATHGSILQYFKKTP
jgi:hypothetical protein